MKIKIGQKVKFNPKVVEEGLKFGWGEAKADSIGIYVGTFTFRDGREYHMVDFPEQEEFYVQLEEIMPLSSPTLENK